VIKQVWSPGVVQMLSDKEVREHILDKAADRFNETLDQELTKTLKKAGGGR